MEEEISFKQLILKLKLWWLFFFSKWKLFLLVGLIGAIMGFVYAWSQKPVYTATLTFALEEDKGGGGVGGALGLASSLGIDLGTNAGGMFSGANIIELFKSRRMIEKVLLDSATIDRESITLIERYLRSYGFRNKWKKKKKEENQSLHFPPGVDRANFTLQQDSILGVIYKRILESNLFVIQKDKKVSIINIDVKSEDEIFSKYFAETLAKEVSDFYIETKSMKARANVEILQKQADSIRAELNHAITGVAQSNDNTYNLNPAMNVQRTPSARRQVDVQANTAILTQLVTNLELAKVSLRKETPLIQIIDKPILPLQKNKASTLISMITGGLLAAIALMIYLVIKKLFDN